MKLTDVKPGMMLVADDGFSCIKGGARLTVQVHANGLFVPCRFGEHFLVGQVDADGEVIGFSLVPQD